MLRAWLARIARPERTLRSRGPVTPAVVRAYEQRAEALVTRATLEAERKARGSLLIRGSRWLRRRLMRRPEQATPAPVPASPRQAVSMTAAGFSRETIPAPSGLRIAIKSPAPDAVVGATWGDFHFAHALARALERRGHSVRVDHRDGWAAATNRADDAVVVLRGRHRYRPDGSAAAILWNISHPDLVEREEYEDFDQVFVASAPGARTLQARFPHLRVGVLLQAFDAERFRPATGSRPAFDVLFVGNTRGVHRPVVIDAIEAGLPLTVFGKGWERLIPRRFIGGGPVPNEQLPRMYGSAKVVLNDHWPSMRASGFISNRIFDAVACGVPVVTDPVLGLTDVFGAAVPFYQDRRDLARTVRTLLTSRDERVRLVAQGLRIVHDDHDFDDRARVIEEALLEIRSS